MKRITWWPQAWLGLTFNWGALMGYAAAGGFAASVIAGGFIGPFAALLWGGLWLWLAGVFWTLGYDTIYALQDIEDDAMVGMKSSARRLGPDVRKGVAVFYAISVLLVAGVGWAAALSPLFYVGLAAYAGHLAWQVRTLKPADGALALRLFKSNREAGMILLAAIALGAVSVSL
jgi:4-hydroxybenzoate polyprenyltransferase